MHPLASFAMQRVSRGAGIADCSFSGSFDTTAAPTTITSPTRTVTVPAGNSGSLAFGGFAMIGTVTPQYSKNGGAFTTFADGDVVVFASGDTLAFRITGATSGEALSFTILDNSTLRILDTVDLVSS